MSYANVAKENRLPESQQPHPDPNLLEGHNKPETQLNAPQAGEMNEKAEQAKQQLEQGAHEAEEVADSEAQKIKRKMKDLEALAEKEAKRGKAEAKDIDRRLHQQYRLNPQLWNGVMGAVNIVSLAAAGYLAYANWDKPRWDRRVVVGITAGLAALFTPQGVFAGEEYQQRKSSR